MIFDIILVLIFITLIVINVCRGAIRSLAGILVAAVSYFAATAIGQAASGYLYDLFVQPAVNDAVTKAVESVTTETTNGVASSLPAWLTGLAGLSSQDLTSVLKDPIASAGDTVSTAVNAAIRPVTIAILTFFITILMFFLLWFVLRKLVVKPLVRLFKFPVLNFLNRFLGAVIGAVDAFLLVSMLAYLTKVILQNVGSTSAWFNESTIYNSFIFYHFYSGNIFSWIGSLITG